MKVKKIFCLLGYSGSGKDTILKRVISKNDKVKPLISYTTRPIRPNETEGVEYFFIDDKKFDTMDDKGRFIEKREYHTKVESEGKIVNAVWKYGFSKDVVEKYKYSICIIDGGGFKELKKTYGNGVVVPIFIQVDDFTLKNRALKRGDLEEEVDRRLEDDFKKFFEFRLKNIFETVKNGDGQLDNAVENVSSIIDRTIREYEERVNQSKTKRK